MKIRLENLIEICCKLDHASDNYNVRKICYDEVNA